MNSVNVSEDDNEIKKLLLEIIVELRSIKDIMLQDNKSQHRIKLERDSAIENKKILHGKNTKNYHYISYIVSEDILLCGWCLARSKTATSEKEFDDECGLCTNRR